MKPPIVPASYRNRAARLLLVIFLSIACLPVSVPSRADAPAGDKPPSPNPKMNVLRFVDIAACMNGGRCPPPAEPPCKFIFNETSGLRIENCEIEGVFDFEKLPLGQREISSSNLSLPYQRVEYPLVAINCRFKDGIKGNPDKDFWFHFVKSQTFMDCYTKYLDFGGARFSDLQFYKTTIDPFTNLTVSLSEGPAKFKQAIFDGKAVFYGSRFFGGADFSEIHFMGAVFSGVTFYDDVTFYASSFQDRADFYLAGFKKGSCFSSVGFGGYAQFRRAKFGALTDFSNSTFHDTADFSFILVPSGAEMIFDQSEFQEKLLFDSAKFESVPSLQAAGIGHFPSFGYKGRAEEDKKRWRFLDLRDLIYPFSEMYYFANIRFGEKGSQKALRHNAHFAIHYRTILIVVFMTGLAGMIVIFYYYRLKRKIGPGPTYHGGLGQLRYIFFNAGYILCLTMIINYYSWLSLNWFNIRYFLPYNLFVLVVCFIVLYFYLGSWFRGGAPTDLDFDPEDLDRGQNPGLMVRKPLTGNFAKQRWIKYQRPMFRLLEEAVAKVDSATFGLTGRRGTGKTFVARDFAENHPDQWFGTTLAAPTGYNEKEFVNLLYSHLAEKTIKKISEAEKIQEKFPYISNCRLGVPALSGYLLAQLAFSAASAAFIWWYFRPGDFYEGLPLIWLLGIVLVELFQLFWRYNKYQGFHARFTNDEEFGDHGRAFFSALEAREALRYQRSRQESETLGVSRWGISLGRSRSQTKAEREATFIQLVDRFNRFAALVAKALSPQGIVVIAIDELDKMESPGDAKNFLNRIKGVFQTPGVIYLITLSDDIIESFNLRTLQGQDPLDSCFDDIFYLGPLTAKEGMEFLAQRMERLDNPRVRALPEERPEYYRSLLVMLSVLSGGVPRELLRLTRRLVPDREAPAFDKFADKEKQELYRGMIQAVRGSDLKPSEKETVLGAVGTLHRADLWPDLKSIEASLVVPANEKAWGYISQFRKQKTLIEFLEKEIDHLHLLPDPNSLGETVSDPYLSWQAFADILTAARQKIRSSMETPKE